MTDADQQVTLGGLPIETIPTVDDLGPDAHRADPGQPPYVRGIHRTMYTQRRWTMRQYAGFSSAAATNERFRLLLDRGQKGLSVAFDLPTQLGLDADDPLSQGEVGRVGVSVSTLDDMRDLFRGIPLDSVSTSMTINAPAMVLLAMYAVVAEENGVPMSDISGTIQNDILKEYIARGTYIFPPGPSMRLICDIFEFCSTEIPRWNTISISGYHIREAGSTAVQELAFTLADALAYVEAAVDRGLDVDSFAPRLSFFFNCHNDFFEEVAKFRAARMLWHRLMTDRFSPSNPKSTMLRFHTQVAGVSLTAQQPLNNVARVTIQAMAAVCGGTQSLHTNSYDEAIGLPTEASATVALRTQQILAEESGIADVVDPLAGSYHVERLTDIMVDAVLAEIQHIDERGGALKAVEDGYQQREIHRVAFQHQRDVEEGRRAIVGVNVHVMDEEGSIPVQRIDPELARAQHERLDSLRSSRNQTLHRASLDALRIASRGTSNLFPYVLDAVRAEATVGEICTILRETFGEYTPPGGL
jgi:methylmalonyl-CoA mutase N-terminal domain/subunit